MSRACFGSAGERAGLAVTLAEAEAVTVAEAEAVAATESVAVTEAVAATESVAVTEAVAATESVVVTEAVAESESGVVPEAVAGTVTVAEARAEPVASGFSTVIGAPPPPEARAVREGFSRRG